MPAFAADGSFSGWAAVRPDWSPPALSDDERAAAAAAVRYYEHEMLAPGDPVEIIGRVHSLLGHWRERDGLDEATRDQVYRDWLTLLHPYPLWAVCEAALEWLNYNDYRPSLARIRLLSDQAVRPEAERLRLLRRALAGPDVGEPRG